MGATALLAACWGSCRFVCFWKWVGVVGTAPAPTRSLLHARQSCAHHHAQIRRETRRCDPVIPRSGITANVEALNDNKIAEWKPGQASSTPKISSRSPTNSFLPPTKATLDHGVRTTVPPCSSLIFEKSCLTIVVLYDSGSNSILVLSRRG